MSVLIILLHCLPLTVIYESQEMTDTKIGIIAEKSNMLADPVHNDS